MSPRVFCCKVPTGGIQGSSREDRELPEGDSGLSQTSGSRTQHTAAECG